MEITKLTLQTALVHSWSRQTSSTPEEWSKANKSRGQCVPSSLVVQDYFGGELQKLITVFNGKKESHYRNILDDGSVLDVCRSQYPADQILHIDIIDLKDFISVRQKLLSDQSTLRRYLLLKKRIEKYRDVN